MAHRVFITRKIPDAGLSIIREKFEVDIWDKDYPATKQDIMDRLDGCQALVSLLSDSIDRDVIDAGKNLKIIANYAVGYDNIDVAYAEQKGVWVTNTPHVLTDATAELAWALLFAVARRVVESDRYVRAGQFRGWQPELLLGREINNATLGIIGAGRIGQAFAYRGRGFNLKYLYFSRHRKENMEKDLNAIYATPEQIFKESDFISVHLSYTDILYHFIGERLLKISRKKPILINTARGKLIDEKALVWALKQGVVQGAGLDVFEDEPFVNNELLKMDNVVLLPHIGSATFRTRNNMAELVAKNVVGALLGNSPVTPVNKPGVLWEK